MHLTQKAEFEKKLLFAYNDIMDKSTNGSFDELVAGISAEERKFLLNRLNQNKENLVPLIQSSRDDADPDVTLQLKLQNESLLYKIFLWIRSLFTKRTTSQLYNDDLVSSIGRKIEKSHAGIIDMHNGLLQSLFYEKLKELKNSADFFKPYCDVVSENPGKFYVFMSTFICPEIAEKINSEADPYSIPFEREPTNELRASLIRRMENVFKEMSGGTRNRLYNAVLSIEWLRQFSGLPYIHFISQFTAIISESYTCPFVNAKVDYPAFARVLSSASSVSNEALEALFLFPQKNEKGIKGLDGDGEKSIREFMSKAAGSISMIQMFISSVPLTSLGRVIFDNFDWQPDTYGGAENWFNKYKDEWKVVFDSRWNSWLRDRKKTQLASVLNKTFGIESFPELPYRPWSKLWGGVLFRCELTGGFLWWFATNKFDEVMKVMNVLVLEGVFINNENRAQLSEALNEFAEENQHMIMFGDSLQERGSIGTVFSKLISEHIRTLKGQAMVDGVILNAETTVRDYGKRFCESLKSIEQVLSGVLDDVKEKGYESIQNLNTIKGRENRAFRDSLEETRGVLLQARKIFSEIEPLDLPVSS